MMIAVDLIDIVSGLREDTAEERAALDVSIRHQGLLQRIVAISHPDIPGRYICVAGRRRLLSHRRLGLGEIDCLVMSGDEVAQELVEIAENLIRVDLSPLERARQLARYVDLYSVEHPEIGEAMRQRRRANLKVGDLQADAEARGAPLEVEGAPLPAVKAVARATGKSVRTIQKAISRAEKARVFTPDQATVLAASHLSDRRIDRLTQIEDPSRRAEVINLVGASMSFPAAMREVIDDYEGDQEEDEGVSDEEFLAECPIRDRVNRQKFDADALLWRRCAEARRAFARSVGWGKLKGDVGPKGLYFRRLLFTLDAARPSEWLQCHDCTQGVTKKGTFIGECNICKGCGYLIK